MKKSLISLAIAAGLAVSAAAQAEVEVKWFGFAQITAEQLDQDKPADGVVFGADRVRIGFKLKDGPVFGKLQIDFNKTDSKPKPGTLPQIIKDVEVGYKFNDAAKVKLGQFKTPLGMDFNTSGKKLDITKRGMEKKLVFERTAGVMVSGRKIANGFGYDVFYGNPAGRGSASVGGTPGQDNTTVVRVMYDMGKMMHVELARGVESTSAVGKDDYEATDFAFRFESGASTAKFEWIDGTSVKGVAGRDESVWFAHYGHMVGKSTELVARYYSAESDLAGASTDRTNTYLGANFFLGSSKTNGRLQVNYVMVGGDDINSSTPYSGVAEGYSDNALLTQYQMSF